MPEAGKANEALFRLLAKEWRLPRSRFTITAGAGDRRKTIAVAGDPDAVIARLAAWGRRLGKRAARRDGCAAGLRRMINAEEDW